MFFDSWALQAYHEVIKCLLKHQVEVSCGVLSLYGQTMQYSKAIFAHPPSQDVIEDYSALSSYLRIYLEPFKVHRHLLKSICLLMID